MRDWWVEYGLNKEADVTPLCRNNQERIGYPTQKPLKLFSRIIRASSPKDGIVLDPFAGCATTCIAGQSLERKWVGIDIWDGAEDALLRRMDKEGMLAEGKRLHEGELFPKDITFTKKVPVRTDDEQPAVPFLQVKYEKAKEPPGPKMTRTEIYEILLSQQGCKCQGCDREFNDKSYLQLDHNTPRSDGGINHISSRILLCGPCNQLKSNVFTLSGLRRENKTRGYMNFNTQR